MTHARQLWLKSALIACCVSLAPAAVLLFGSDFVPAPIVAFLETAADVPLAAIRAIGAVPGADLSESPIALAAATLVWAVPLLAGALHPVVQRAWPSRPDLVRPVRPRDHVDPEAPDFANRPALLGREESMQALIDFAESQAASEPRWAQLTGPHGVGKTHLAYEWLARLEERGWDASLLAPGTDASAITEARFRAKTAIVIDEAGRTPEFWEQLAALLAAKSRMRVFVIDHIPLEVPENLSRPERTRIGASRVELGDPDDPDFDPVSRLDRDLMRRLAPDVPEDPTSLKR